MSKPKLYLDNCCFNRPFDDQTQLTVFLEAQAIEFVQDAIEDGRIELIWSFVLDDENNQNPDTQKSGSIRAWKYFAVDDVDPHPDIFRRSKQYENSGVKAMDALHLACAVFGKADFFLTTDLRLLNKNVPEITMIDPIRFVRFFERNEKNE